MHKQPFADAGSHGQLLMVVAPKGAKVGETKAMGVLHATGNGKDGAYVRYGMPGGPTTAGAKARTATRKVRKLKRDAGPQGPYPAQAPVQVCKFVRRSASAKTRSTRT